MTIRNIVLAFAALPVGAAASAAVLTPISYSMTNGGSGSFVYRDSIYTGTSATGNPNVDYSALSGGLGKLTDGVVGGNNILVPDPTSTGGETREWVGWRITGVAQVQIVFDFGQVVSFDSLSLHAANFSPFGDVTLPGLSLWDVSDNALTWSNIGSVVPDAAAQANPNSQWVTLSPVGVNASGRYARLTMSYGPQPWIFASEVRFTGVPTPGPTALLALAGLAVLRRRR